MLLIRFATGCGRSMIRRSSGRIRRLIGSSSCVNVIFCPTSNGYRPPPFIRGLTIARSGIPSGRLMILSGTTTDQATVGTASVTSRPLMKNLHRFRTKMIRTSPSPGWITTRGKTANCFQTIIHIRRKPTRVPKKRWINLWRVLMKWFRKCRIVLLERKKWPLLGIISK